MGKYDELDNLLFQFVDNIETEKIDNDEIKKIIEKSKLREYQKKKKNLKIAVIVVIILFCTFSTAIYLKKEKIILNANYIDKTNISEENVIDYYNDSDGIGTSTVNLTFEQLYDLCDYVAIVKIESGMYVTNYDREYGPHYNGEYRYTSVRTIGQMKVLKSFKGDLNDGDIVEFRKKGGKLPYSQYLKYCEENNIVNEEINSKYEKLKEEGKKDIYINFQSNNSVEIEENKEYLVCITKKSWGDFWLESGLNAIREYDSKNNMILNNNTGKWEDLEKYID